MRSPRGLLVLLPVLLALGCGGLRITIGVPAAGGGLPVTVSIPANVDPADVEITLDGDDVRPLFAAGGGGIVATLPLPAPGAHSLVVRGTSLALVTMQRTRTFDVPAATPALAIDVPIGTLPVTAWLRFDFAEDIDPEALAGFGFALSCGGAPVERLAYTVEDRSVVLDPTGELPAGSCRVVWRDASGVVDRTFTVAARAAATPATAIYDRDDYQVFGPFPDDWWSVADGTTPTGMKLSFSGPVFEDLRDSVIAGIATSLSELDGWSPVGPIVLSFSHAVDPALLPTDEFAAAHPFSPIALLDADPASPDYGARIPFMVEARNDLAPDGSFDHTLILFPSITLRPAGRYAVVVTQRLFADGDASRPIGPSTFFERVLAVPTEPPTPDEESIREKVDPLLGFLETVPAVPIDRDDVALVLRISTRSYARDASDMVAIKENALAAPPPPLTVTSITTSAQRRLIVRGRLALPRYVVAPNGSDLTRDASGRPLATVTENVPFTMTLPNQALSGPVPIVIFQHGSPGSQEDIVTPTNNNNNEFLDDAGYAILGIQDAANRRYGADSAAQTAAVLFHLIEFGHIPLLEMQTHADLQALVRAISGIATTDWLPNGAPDGVLELDPSRIVYRGVSFGAHHSLGFLPFAPEVRAAASLVGGGRFYENSIHQIDHYDFFDQIQDFIPDLRPIELLVGLAAIQNDEDRQDPHLLARHLYRDRLPIAGISPTAPPTSLLWIEGIGDGIVSNNATRAAARELGIPQVERVKRASPGLDSAPAPLAGNIGPTSTAGHFQYVPSATPSCIGVVFSNPGHHCPQRAAEGRQQILHFFSTALGGGAPVIIDPLP